MARPDYSLEIEQGAPARRVAGLDEVGRGPLAGPVVACAVILDMARLDPALADRLDDSKRLTAARRAEIAGLLRASPGVIFALGAASVREIERLNILQASLLAMRRATARLPVKPDFLLIDGNRLPKELPCPALAVVKGDSRSLSIAAASILAKVTRDRAMAALARRWPAYGWENNAGYGAPAHLAGLRSAGITPHHRRGFAPIAQMGE
jgi:ribonuclease HII